MDIGAWLRSLGLGKYEQAFIASAIDSDVLPELTEIDFEKLGIPLGDRKRLMRAISPMVASSPRAVAKADAQGAERRHLTVMFCDLVGSTALSARLDPEDLRELLRVYFARVDDVAGRHGGFVAKYLGDGALIYFGSPQAHEDDAERAVRAGLALVDSVSELTAGGERL